MQALEGVLKCEQANQSNLLELQDTFSKIKRSLIHKKWRKLFISNDIQIAYIEFSIFIIRKEFIRIKNMFFGWENAFFQYITTPKKINWFSRPQNIRICPEIQNQ